jgi:hypothetical protein
MKNGDLGFFRGKPKGQGKLQKDKMSISSNKGKNQEERFQKYDLQ